ncbi:MAG: permease [Candidatus Omnitrophica bacterium]|nr:permease [Candidatus Omnitrophota bacterium]
MVTDPVCGMKINEETALKISKEGREYYFCSSHCLKKFSGQDFNKETIAECSAISKKRLFKNKNLIVGFILASLILASYSTPFLEGFRQNFIMYFKKIWWAVVLGLFIGGVIDYYIPREYISHLLARKDRKSIIYSVILGFLMSACSHGILALAIQLHKKGASNASVVAFLLASPWANMTLTIMLIGFFGLRGLFIIVSAVIIAIVTGFIYQLLQEKNLIEENANVVATDQSFSVMRDVKTRLRSYKFSFQSLLEGVRGVRDGAFALADMVLWWILIGMALASLAAAYIPRELFVNYMGPTFLGLAVTLALATVIEVCSEGSAPLAFEIFRQTGALGNSFVFLMAGVVTDYTEIGLLWHNVGRRVAIWLPIITVPQVILLGMIANAIF